MKIEINYFNPQKPVGIVTGSPTVVPLKSEFSFFSHDGHLEIQFIGKSPLKGDDPPKKLAADGTTTFVASNIGHFKFQCFINGQLVPTGGELDVPRP